MLKLITNLQKQWLHVAFRFECVIATHTDTETVHSHIIVNAISFENGRKLHCNIREYGQMKDLANKLGAEREVLRN